MKIKKNGVTINLTEGDIKKLRKSIIKEGLVFPITVEELKQKKGNEFEGVVNEQGRITIYLKKEDGNLDRAMELKC